MQGSVWGFISEIETVSRKGIDIDMSASQKYTEQNWNNEEENLDHISHSVRTPIHTIMGMADLALEEVNDPQAVANYLQKIKRAGDVLISQINELLEITNLEDKETVIKQELCNYESITRLIEGQIQLYAEEKKIDGQVHVEGMTRTTFMQDTVKLEQILGNLISNAVKFTPEHGEINVTVETLSVTSDTIWNRYTVSDSGIGMNRDFQKRMFYPFMKEDNEVNTSQKGAGLGLYMVKRLVELMKGTVSVHSSPGKGTSIIVELPGRICSEQEHRTTEHKEEDISILRNKRILLCEDNELNAEMTKDILVNAGILVECVSNGEEAVEHIRSTEPFYYDAVLMDIRMPVMNGLEATDVIRRMGRDDTYMIPIVALTASAYQMDYRKALAAGMDAFLTKPFEVRTLLEQLAGFWRVYNKEQV